MGVGRLSGGERGCGRPAAAGWLARLGGGAAAGSFLLIALLRPGLPPAAPSSLRRCGLRVGSRPGGSEMREEVTGQEKARGRQVGWE